MGMDITVYQESRTPAGKWICRDDMSGRDVGSDGGIITVHNWEHAVYTGRNGRLMELLTGQYNYGDEITRFPFDRGIPNDASIEVRKVAEEGRQGGNFYFSWLTAREILDYDWTQRIEQSTKISAEAYWWWNRRDRRRSRGPGSDHSFSLFLNEVPEAELQERLLTIESQFNMDARSSIPEIIRSQLGDVCCKVTWSEPLHILCADFWYETIPRLLRLGKPEDVRIIYWFSS
jgi:hypothetical protein